MQKILLIQVRKDQAAVDHERELVLKHAHLDEAQIEAINVLDKHIDIDKLDQYKGIIIGGSGDFLISKNDIPELVDHMGEAAHKARHGQIPTLGICFGAQVLTKVFGGELICDEARAETGTFEITMHDHAQHCPIFSQVPTQFHAQLGHKDHINQLPEGAVLLGGSERSAVQAFTFPGEPIYGFTYHPELDQDGMIWRMDFYGNMYKIDKAQLAAMRDQLLPSPHGCSTLKLFMDEVIEKGNTYPRL